MNKNITVGIHIAFCWAFHGPKPSLNHSVDHKDRNTKNWKPSNLKWATRSEQNLNQAPRKLGQRTSVTKSVNQIDFQKGNIIQTFVSVSEAGRICNIDITSISKCCLLKNISAGGYKWNFSEEEILLALIKREKYGKFFIIRKIILSVI